MTSWKNINTLRKIDIDISGQEYSANFNEDGLDLENTHYCASYIKNKPTKYGKRELLELRYNNGEIEYRQLPHDYGYKGSIKTFNTHLGTFASIDEGEFGGNLCIVSKDGKDEKDIVMYGNITDVFDIDNHVYAIESLDHICLSNFGIYELLKKNNNISVEYIKELGWNESYKGRVSYNDDTELIVTTEDTRGTYDNHGVHVNIYKLHNSKLEIVGILNDIHIGDVSNILYINNKLYLGCDKLLKIIDLKTLSIEYFTHKSEEAVENLTKNFI